MLEQELNALHAAHTCLLIASEFVLLLLTHGADPSHADAKGARPLESCETLAVLTLLQEHKADPDLVSTSEEHNGKPALHRSRPC